MFRTTTLYLILFLIVHNTVLQAGNFQAYTGTWEHTTARIGRLVLKEDTEQALVEAWNLDGGIWTLQASAPLSPVWSASSADELIPAAGTATLTLGTDVLQLSFAPQARSLEVRISDGLTPAETYTYTRMPADNLITGRALGMASSTASLFRVTLYGPDDSNTPYLSQPLSLNGYRFEGLPDGVYFFSVESASPINQIQPTPAFHTIEVRNGQVVTQDIELN
ncbi:MAG: hypothetical protein SF053_16420 [Bacteroidia bacterium]|nr:hypothetical protein [Bacteroidia bacterium]